MAALAAHQPGEIDWITFVGSGETTLHSGIGWLIREVKSRSDLPVAVITNGSLLYLPGVREELLAADAVLPSLDAGNARLYRKINRSWPKLTFDRLVEGLVTFKQIYQGQFWVEVMLVQGVNDTEEALLEIAEILNLIQPDQVHINTPTRPPVEAWVHPPDPQLLALAKVILGEIASVIPPATGMFDLAGDDDLVESILGILTRHPIREQELFEALERKFPEKVSATLETLRSSGQAQFVDRNGERFLVAAGANFPDNSLKTGCNPVTEGK